MSLYIKNLHFIPVVILTVLGYDENTKIDILQRASIDLPEI